MACDAMADEDMIASKAVEGMTAWCLDALMEMKPKCTECPRHSQEEVRLERWTGVGWVTQGRKNWQFCVVLGKKQLGVRRLVPASIAPSVAAKARPNKCLLRSPCSTAKAWTPVWFSGWSRPPSSSRTLQTTLSSSHHGQQRAPTRR